MKENILTHTENNPSSELTRERLHALIFDSFYISQSDIRLQRDVLKHVLLKNSWNHPPTLLTVDVEAIQSTASKWIEGGLHKGPFDSKIIQSSVQDICDEWNNLCELTNFQQQVEKNELLNSILDQIVRIDIWYIENGRPGYGLDDRDMIRNQAKPPYSSHASQFVTHVVKSVFPKVCTGEDIPEVYMDIYNLCEDGIPSSNYVEIMKLIKAYNKLNPQDTVRQEDIAFITLNQSL
jgi:hypothetical protein